MLTIYGGRHRLCDSLTRRDFLSIGSLTCGGLSLADVLRAEDAQPRRQSHKSVIMIYLTGGPPHQDMLDLKPDAPQEIRGEFSPIDTCVPGIQISELMPRVAQMMDKFVSLRTLVGSDGRHSSFQCVTGDRFASQPPGGSPELGSILSRLHGTVDTAIPPAIDLSMKMEHLPYNLPGPGFLGSAHAPFRPSGPARDDMILQGISVDRFDNRRQLLDGFNAARRRLDRSAYPRQADVFTRQALDVLTSSRLADALNLELEDPRIRARYGKDDPKVLPYSSKGYQAIVSKFLLARRLVEAGARCVTVSYADFDWHGSNFTHARKVVPLLDQGLSALVQDLHERGLEQDVTVVVWGEFGRTPKINKSAGRDHWSRVACGLLAGGGMATGQQIGKTNRLAEEPVDRPVHFREVFATLYRNLGIDPQRTTLTDLGGRPRYLLDDHRPIPELV